MYEELVKRLRHCSEEHSGCGTCELSDTCVLQTRLLLQAADAIEELEFALLLMVLQYCTTDDGLLFHEFISAGENAFAVLGLENGQQEATLWCKMARMSERLQKVFAYWNKHGAKTFLGNRTQPPKEET